MGGSNGGGGSSQEQDESVKHMFDRIGQQVHDEVKNGGADAKKYVGELEGSLSQVSINLESAGTTDTCNLVKEYYKHPNGGGDVSDKRYPCKGLSEKYVERFSDKIGGQCTKEKISGSTNTCGACAPYRRLHLCHHNLESIQTKNYNSSNAKHDLLAEVCMAAKYEGETLTTEHGKHQQTNNDSQICTVLARSFADIGDIVRGRDLFHGNPQESAQRKVLDEKLKEIFKEIHSGLTKKDAQTYYDENGGNFFKLREDWWTANRHTVWEAMTCHAGDSDEYFRKTCGSGNNATQAKDKCRCSDNQVPTYFDYVPQYLRWFEEWAEDFCRLRKHKLKDAIDKCRGGSSNDKYCSGNGFDCVETVRGDEHFVEKDCHDCSYSCSPFVKWIDNQKLELDKQKKKYKSEITRGASGKSPKRTKRGARASDDNGYESKFYKILKEKNNYGTVGEFLRLLNNEKTCKDQPQVGNEKASPVDFTKGKTKETFSRTEICEPCPWCGAEKDNTGNGKWKDKELNCGNKKHYHPEKTTTIEILTADKKQSGIVKKYSKFCTSANGGESDENVQKVARSEKSKNGDQIVTWECYYDKEKGSSKNNNNCVEGTWKDFEKGKNVMPYHPFFWKWVHDMLHDSVEWKTELSKCINNKKGSNCIGGCKKTCECFQKWVVQKGKEWDEIKVHFNKQEDIVQPGSFIEFSPYGVLDLVLKGGNLLQNIKDVHGDTEDIKYIKDLLNDEEAAGVLVVGSGGENKTTIDKLIEHEKEQAEQCKKCEEAQKPQQEREDLARSLPTPEDSSSRPTQDADTGTDDIDDDDEEDEEDDVDPEEEADLGEENHQEESEDKDDANEAAVVPQPEEPQEPVPTDDVNVCETVATALTGDDLKQACSTKYGPKAPTSWKCVPSGVSTATSGEGGDAKSRERREAGVPTATSSGNTTGGGKDGATGGSICVPPRRRRLYVGGLTKWAKKYTGNTGESKSQEGVLQTKAVVDGKANAEGGGQKGARGPNGGTEGANIARRRRPTHATSTCATPSYKKEKEKEKEDIEKNGQDTVAYTSSVEKDPQEELQRGDIPDGFLRQMFYTLGDYRDILYSGDKENGNKYMLVDDIKDISDKIKSILNSDVGQKTTAKQWWDDNGQHIWNGMIYALTYNTDTPSGDKPTQIDEVRAQLWDEKEKKPKKTDNDHDYTYENVELKEDDDQSGAKTPSASSGSNDPINNPQLSDFVEIPTYFRWLHEWGSDFCGTRKRMLGKIKHECRGDKVCSGYGENCDDQLKDNPSIFPSLNCPSCGTPCRYYKKWINTKKTEYDKQKSAYEQQQGKCEKENNGAEGNDHDKKFCTRIQNCNEAKDFLKTLGPCRTNDESGKGTLYFDDDTFKHADNCKPCSSFKIYCKNCKSSGGTENKCPKGKISADDIPSLGNSTHKLDMRVSDKNAKDFAGDLSVCADADIFTGIKEHKWKCRNVCGYVVCKPENGNTETTSGENNDQIITIRALVTHWVHNFLEDYNRIKQKISHCKENSEQTICKKDCKDKCKCVDEWINKKRTEWDNIKKLFIEQYKMDSDEYYYVRSCLEDFESRPELNKAIKPCPNLNNFKTSCGLNDTESSKKKDGDKRDLVVCLLNKLEKKAEKYKDNHETSGEEKECDSLPHVEDDDDPLEEVDQNPEEAKKNMMPTFCEIQEKKEKEEGTCEKAVDPGGDGKPKGDQDGGTAAGPEADPEADPETEPAPAGDQKEASTSKVAPKPKPPRPQPQPPTQLLDNPHVQTALMSSTIMWSIGIGFAAFTYFYLKVNGRDSGTDSGYTDHYSDITSSSESEYEELDINDIYVPGSPKYKTLIEVVLEPSGNNTTASGNNTTASGNNTTASGNNTTASGNNTTASDIPSDNTPTPQPITDDEWNTLKDEFISQYIQSEQPNDVPNDYKSGNSSTNTNITTMSRDNVDEKPFITSIHDRDLYTGEEYNYNINMSTNSMDDPKYVSNNVYSGIDLINDSLNSGNQHIDIYDELLKRKENELFGTENTKRTSTYSVAKNTNSDPILNQINLFHKWLDRHRDMCETLKNDNERLAKLKEEWENDTSTSGNTHPSDSNKTLNTDVSIQIDMDNPKPTNEFTYVDSNPNQVDDTYVDSNPDNSSMDTILDDLEKYNEPYYDMYDDDIYYDVNDDNDTSTVDTNNMDVPSKVQIEMDVNTKLVKEKYPISDVWDI
ncbi:hypothetical protein PFNF54_04072 [Plasmodium falciparum NF54]|uniref:Erythrocyte membrane protein 1 n=1 Tax=Plasmodium falciparum (isolate NF54) TaxID=5843 RepID=W7JQ66_PLAFO|nr:hypothetical protein PFNF54_04072 [Plasmodium falciparum NF54]